METFLVWAGLIAFGVVVVKVANAQDRQASKGADQIVCPHCQHKGSVSVRIITRGKGISGGKATGALMTGGVSMFATGLSKNVPTRNLSCSNCGMKWDVA